MKFESGMHRHAIFHSLLDFVVSSNQAGKHLDDLVYFVPGDNHDAIYGVLEGNVARGHGDTVNFDGDLHGPGDTAAPRSDG